MPTLEENHAEYNRAIKESRTPTPEQVSAHAIIKKGDGLANTVLDRTTADIASGKSTVPFRQLNPEQQEALSIHYLNESRRANQITSEQYKEGITQIGQTLQEQQAQRTIDFGKEASVRGRSETAKQDEARAIAGMQGVAVGTVSKTGKANTSVNSVLFQNQASSFAEGQKNINKVQKEKQNYNYSVTLTEGGKKSGQSYIGYGPNGEPIQGPVRSNYNYEITLTEGKRESENVFLLSNFLPKSDIGSYFVGKSDRITAERKEGDPLQNVGASLWNALRYSDRVDSKETKKT